MVTAPATGTVLRGVTRDPQAGIHQRTTISRDDILAARHQLLDLFSVQAGTDFGPPTRSGQPVRFGWKARVRPRSASSRVVCLSKNIPNGTSAASPTTSARRRVGSTSEASATDWSPSPMLLTCSGRDSRRHADNLTRNIDNSGHSRPARTFTKSPKTAKVEGHMYYIN